MGKKKKTRRPIVSAGVEDGKGSTCDTNTSSRNPRDRATAPSNSQLNQNSVSHKKRRKSPTDYDSQGLSQGTGNPCSYTQPSGSGGGRWTRRGRHSHGATSNPQPDGRTSRQASANSNSSQTHHPIPNSVGSHRNSEGQDQNQANMRYRQKRRHKNPFRGNTHNCDRHRQHGHRPAHGQTYHSGDDQMNEPAASSAGSSSDLEIPGYYYDPQKKKYFKILPGQNSANSTMITREIIKLKKTEEARQDSLREFALKIIQKDPTYTGNSAAHIPRCHYSRNIVDHLHCVQNGMLRASETRSMQHQLTNHQLRNLQAVCKRKIFGRGVGLGPYKKLEHMTQMMVAPGDDARVLCLWSLEGLIVQRIQLLQVDRVALHGSPPEGATLSLTPVGASLLQSFSKVTNVCWAPSTPGQTTNVPILYTTTCFIGNSPSLALLRTLEEPGDGAEEGGRAEGSTYAEFHLGHTTTWTCAWSTHRQKFSIGSKESALVVDVATRRLWELFTKKSDVYSQVFSHSDGNTLYSGTHRGLIVAHDLRSASTRYVTALSHRSPVCHLHLLQSDQHLLAADFSGRLCMWDLRMRSVVQDYIGHNNEYVRIPFKVDPSESIICGVGQDCYTRLWDLQTGSLLTSVPPPYPASRDLIPSVTVYPVPHGHLDRPGLLMGIKDEMHFYTA